MTMDSSYVGRYGTLSLMKKDGSDIPIAHYPIDDEEITIGRDPNCSVRLYYDTISKLHCKVTFEDAKAFLTVYGTSGLVADGFPLFPTATGPTTVPLGNNTEIEIHRKRFIFTYPPKDLRAMILATPEPDRNDNKRKTLRMSMIASAMVFTPRPSQDPRENLRTLQSPLKPNYSSPLRPTHNEEPEEEDIVLVESNHPNVVQDDEDNLVILESVQTPKRFVQFTPQPHQYQTPRRNPRNSLHRAVLIRSAQRTAMKVEMELEEQQEEMEVEDVVTELEETNLDDNSPEEGDDRDDVVEESIPAEEGMDEQREEQKADEEQEGGDVPRPFGPFMTPQPSAGRASSVLGNRLGLSVQGPQRIRVAQPWRVKDLVVPPPSTVGVKKEDPEVRECISEEEKSAIRARRKSAFMIPDPADSQIPGSRRMSTILQPPTTTAPSVPPSSKKPFIKPDPNPPEEEEDTEVLLEKVKAKIEDLRRRQTIGLGPPPLERQRSRSPTKPDAESLFWGSDSVTSTRIDQVDDKGDTGMDHSHPQDEDEDMDDDEVEEQEVIRQTTPVRSWNPSKAKLPPKTPKMDGMKGLFADPKAVLSTPAMGGIKQLFNEPVEPQTPIYGGVRDMFKTTAAPVVPGTPVLEGVGDLLGTPAAHHKQQSPPEITDASVGTTTADSEAVVPGTKAAAAVRRRKVAAEAKNPVEESIPPTNATQPLKIGRPKKTLKEAVSLPRPPRTKGTTDEAGPSKSVPKSEPARRTRAATEADAEERSNPSQTTDTTGSRVARRTRRTPDVPSNPPPARVTRGRTTPTPTEENETATTTTKKPNSSRATPRRGTRSTPVPDEDQSDPVPALKKSTRGKRVETIKEEDDTTVPSQTTAHKGTLVKKSQLLTRSRTTVNEKDVPTEKENEPNDSGDSSQSQGAPPTRTRRTVAKAPSTRGDVKEPKATTVKPTRATRSKK